MNQKLLRLIAAGAIVGTRSTNWMVSGKARAGNCRKSISCTSAPTVPMVDACVTMRDGRFMEPSSKHPWSNPVVPTAVMFFLANRWDSGGRDLITELEG